MLAAIQWYGRAARAGHGEAAGRASVLLDKGVVGFDTRELDRPGKVESDTAHLAIPSTASTDNPLSWHLLGARAGYGPARQLALSRAYFNPTGAGVPIGASREELSNWAREFEDDEDPVVAYVRGRILVETACCELEAPHRYQNKSLEEAFGLLDPNDRCSGLRRAARKGDTEALDEAERLLGIAFSKGDVRAGLDLLHIEAFRGGLHSSKIVRLRERFRDQIERYPDFAWTLAHFIRPDERPNEKKGRPVPDVPPACAPRSHTGGTVALLSTDVLGQDPSKAILRLKTRAAEGGNVEALWELGTLMLEPSGMFAGIARAAGEQVPAADAAAGARYIKRAADQGSFAARLQAGRLYLMGIGVPQDYLLAAKYLYGALSLPLATSGRRQLPGDTHAEEVEVAKSRLAFLHFLGLGLPKNDALAWMWLRLLKSPPNEEQYVHFAAKLTREISSADRSRGDALAAAWYPGAVTFDEALRNDPDSPPAAGAKSPSMSGTGFRINEASDVLTNLHVVDGCGSITVGESGSAAVVAARDPSNDLAVLRPSGTTAGGEFLRLRSASARLGEEVGVFGFPLGGLLSASGNLTFGTVTSTMGVNNDTSRFQFSAPVQPGNSGGAVTDAGAAVIGVVAAQLRPIASGDQALIVPQNVNFAIKAEVVTTFLAANKIAFHETGHRGTIDRAVLADRLIRATALIECIR